jgi:hypothetical protein
VACLWTESQAKTEDGSPFLVCASLLIERMILADGADGQPSANSHEFGTVTNSSTLWGFSARWVRLTADANCVATARFFYT